LVLDKYVVRFAELPKSDGITSPECFAYCIAGCNCRLRIKQISIMDKPSYLDFDYSGYPWKPSIDYRTHPELYRVGKGEQGVLICQPYKGEIGPYWRFKDAAAATESSGAILRLFKEYMQAGEFVGADMARKYLQMGFTRARRYANYRGGRKYDRVDAYRQLPRGTGEVSKAEAAAIFYDAWQTAESDPGYQEMKIEWKKKYG